MDKFKSLMDSIVDRFGGLIKRKNKNSHSSSREINSYDFINLNEENKNRKVKFTKSGRFNISFDLRNVKKRRYIVLTLIVVLVFFVSYFFVRVKEIDYAKLRGYVDNSTIVKQMIKGDEKMLRKLYGIERGDYEEFISYAPQNNMKANEILIIRAKEGKADEIMAKVNARIDSQSKSFQNYSKDQYEILKNKILEKEGNSVILIVTEDNGQIRTYVDESYK